MIVNITCISGAYLLGSLSTAIIVCRLMGLGDPREGGSGNPGATNVLRLHGKKAGIIALLGDLLKGVIPVLLARHLGAEHWAIAGSGLTVFLGHLYPVFFQFRGGKGVATLLGVLIATSWILGMLFMMTWLIIAGLTRYSSAAGLTAALATPVYAWWLMPDPAYVVGLAVMAVFLVSRHRQNITRLLSGTESRIGNHRQ